MDRIASGRLLHVGIEEFLMRRQESADRVVVSYRLAKRIAINDKGGTGYLNVNSIEGNLIIEGLRRADDAIPANHGGVNGAGTAGVCNERDDPESGK